MSAIGDTHTIRIGAVAVELTEELGYLLGQIDIMGTWHHVELIQVYQDLYGIQQPLTSARVSDDVIENCNLVRYENMGGFNDGEPFRTITVDDREFVCVITPFGK